MMISLLILRVMRLILKSQGILTLIKYFKKLLALNLFKICRKLSTIFSICQIYNNHFIVLLQIASYRSACNQLTCTIFLRYLLKYNNFFSYYKLSYSQFHVESDNIGIFPFLPSIPIAKHNQSFSSPP